ncbi:hypothetical protein FB567DRAFT_67192 [Paraphoma chrysanthemicola]|uniref:Zn(2)-C6 fungal-type domain-containing protein n=1 Tax=Paraphoma chrysanthemicola TaxID=798071 RepID=A0A8K0R3G2_9PLEO|nr:hypothetical protein FB567DRAFT_67192 [Paraphoma chrysanthemicola]
MDPDIPASKTRVSRKAHRKVKTGCRTCKVRRVRCDEGFPACYRCVSIGRICDGYGIWGGGGAIHNKSSQITEAQRTRPSAAPTQAKILVPLMPSTQASLRQGPNISTEEQEYLEWFIHGTSVHTPRIFTAHCWSPLILQATVHSPMTLQALLAISAAHKRKVLDPANRARDGELPDAQEIFLLKQHGRAMKSMQKLLKSDSTTSSSNLSLILIMCGLFVLLERVRGQYEAACLHLSLGLPITAQLAQTSTSGVIDDKLDSFFSRMKDHLIVFGKRKNPAETDASAAKVAPAWRFTSPTDAERHLDMLIDESILTVEQHRTISKTAEASRALLQTEHSYHLAGFDSWYLAYEATVAEERSQSTTEDAKAWAQLRQRYLVGRSMADGHKC